MEEKTIKKKKERATGRHKFFMAILTFLLSPFVRLKFRFSYKKIRLPETPTIVLMNHNSDYDAIYAGIAIKDFMYFVASEHIYRWGFFSKVIKFIFDPIIRVKGTTEARAAMEILKTIRKGNSVCLFAEGNRSFNGETCPILPSTGKLVKKSGAAMVTYVLRGDYLTTPRWGKGIRKGMIKGELINTYSKEQVAAMSDDEINRRIAEDLYVDAYADQARLNVPYHGKKELQAKGIEIALYICPECNKIGSIESENDQFFCDCGLHARYTEYGKLESLSEKALPFETILDWDHWQVKTLYEMLSESDDLATPVFMDDEQELYEISGAEATPLVMNGRLSLFRNRITVENGEKGFEFLFDEVGDIEVTGRMNIAFSTEDKRHYEIKSQRLRSAAKYRESYRFLTGKN